MSSEQSNDPLEHILTNPPQLIDQGFTARIDRLLASPRANYGNVIFFSLISVWSIVVALVAGPESIVGMIRRITKLIDILSISQTDVVTAGSEAIIASSSLLLGLCVMVAGLIVLNVSRP